VGILEFWKMADYDRLQCEYMVDARVRYVAAAPLDALQNIFLQYRYFTQAYGSDLGLLIYKVPYGKFKSLICDIANAELGSGDPGKSHLQLWDNFLLSINVDKNRLENSINSKNRILLDTLRDRMIQSPSTYAIGLRGMGGECLCQVYLTAVYNHLRLNPYIRSNQDNIDWEFWDIHTGEVDVKHRLLVRDAINDLVAQEPTSVMALAEGYQHAKKIWEHFWENAYEGGGYRSTLGLQT
jgi:hypothetical protein